MDNPRVFMDITLGSRQAGRLVFELYFDITPKTAENFRALCTGERANATASKLPLHYKGSIFHRIIGGFMAQGGDFTRADGTGGVSIYGARFADEDFTRKHDQRGLLSMANAGPNSNGSQFFITFAACRHLDNRHVVFGKLVDGFDTLSVMEKAATDPSDRPKVPVTISDCGQLGVEEEEQQAQGLNTLSIPAVTKAGEDGNTANEELEPNQQEPAEEDPENDIEEQTAGMTEKQKRLFMLRLKLNKGRKDNKKEAREEYKRFNDPKYARKQRAEEYREKKQNWEAHMKEHGMDTSESFMFETAAAAETQLEKAKKKDKNRNSFGWAVYTQDSLYKSYKKRISKLDTVTAPSSAEATTEGSTLPSLEENPMNYGRTGKVQPEGMERLVKELQDRDEAKKKYSRRRAHLEGADVDYINKANEHYNKKIKRAFDKYTAEIAQNLERGTAV